MTLLLPMFLACKSVDPAPADLDGLLHWFWDKYQAGSDAEIHEGIVNAFDIVDVEALDEDVQDGSITRLSDEQTDLVGVTGHAAADAAGMYLLNVFDCTIDDLEPILWHLDQDELYDGTYDDYDRWYTSSKEDYAAGLVGALTWDFWYIGSYLGSSYEAEPKGAMRHVAPVDEDQVEGAEHGPVVMTRTYLPQPAEFQSDNKSYDQDYQLEIYVDAGGGRLLHLYGMWREGVYGAGFTTEDEGVQRLILNALADWDDTTEELCTSGIP